MIDRTATARVQRLAPPGPESATRRRTGARDSYEWPVAGHLLHVDIKPLGGIDGVGHRIHGDRRHRRRGIGWEYVHVAIDDHGRIAYVEVLTDQRGPCAALLARAVAWFPARGVPCAGR